MCCMTLGLVYTQEYRYIKHASVNRLERSQRISALGYLDQQFSADPKISLRSVCEIKSGNKIQIIKCNHWKKLFNLLICLLLTSDQLLVFWHIYWKQNNTDANKSMNKTTKDNLSTLNTGKWVNCTSDQQNNQFSYLAYVMLKG